MEDDSLKTPHASTSQTPTSYLSFFSVLHHLFHPGLQWLNSHFLALLSATDWTDPLSSLPVKENRESFNLMKSHKLSSQKTHFWSLQNCYCWEAWSRQNMQSIHFCFQTFLVFFCRGEGKSFIHSSFSNSTLSMWIHSFLGFTGRSSSLCGEKEMSVLLSKAAMKEILFFLCQATWLKDCIK